MNSHDKDMSKRFVIQEHRRDDDVHWDLMLEAGDVLLTWRLDIPPAQITVHPGEAVRISDHPLRFLTYQGPVNKGKGMVKIADKGTYKTENETVSNLEIFLSGRILRGRFRLYKADSNSWRFKKMP